MSDSYNLTETYSNIIYSKIFCELKSQYISVFLCGGASYANHKSIRDQLKKLIDKPQKYRIPMRVFYPEDLLMDSFYKYTDADLLSYERFLADNSDVIAIICESPGSLVELGAFVNNEYTNAKVIAIIDNKYNKDKSFIMQGPIKYLRKIGKYNYVEYSQKNSNYISDLYNHLESSIKFKSGFIRKNHFKSLDITTIVGMHYYIQLLLFFYKELDSLALANMIKFVLKSNSYNVDDFDVLFKAALKLLFHEQSIIGNNDGTVKKYSLTKNGYIEIKKMVNNCRNTYMCDKIRVDIMYDNYYRTSRS